MPRAMLSEKERKKKKSYSIADQMKKLWSEFTHTSLKSWKWVYE
jgi:hypothetical protein